MISEKAKKTIEQVRAAYMPVVDWEAIDWPLMRKASEALITDGPFPDGISWKTSEIGEVPVEWTILPKASGKLILHIHGGGMCTGEARFDRFMLSHIAGLTGRNAVSVNYRLSPEYAAPAAIEDCADVYRGLIREGYAPDDIVLLGESAGGMLALSLCAFLKREGDALPAAVCAISPSVDSQYESQSMETNRDSEIVVNQNIKEMMQAIYFCGADPMDPVLSPIHSDLRGWPPVYLMACREEILRDEAVRMNVKLQEAGVVSQLSIDEGLFHTYMLQDLPESYEAFGRIAEFYARACK